MEMNITKKTEAVHLKKKTVLQKTTWKKAAQKNRIEKRQEQNTRKKEKKRKKYLPVLFPGRWASLSPFPYLNGLPMPIRVPHIFRQRRRKAW